jgi:ATP-dependent helicase/nuclease subunit A
MEPIKKDLMQADPMLNQLLEQSISQRGFGNLCTLYVAMTRAKRGLYMISDLKGAHQGTTVNYLKERLGTESKAIELFPKSNYPVLWSTGDQDWHESFKAAAQPTTNSQPARAPAFDPAHPRLQLARPSTGKARLLAAARYFDLDEHASTFGTAVHDAFEQIEWLEAFESKPQANDNTNLTLDLFEQPVEENAPSFPHLAMTEHCPAEVKDALNSCFANPEICTLFTKPETATVVWRERAFSYVEGDQFTNGIFDRVVIYKAEDGTISRAEIIDFKSDRIHPRNTLEQASQHHRPQLEAYRKALSRIVGIDESVIDLKLLFSDVPQLVEL